MCTLPCPYLVKAERLFRKTLGSTTYNIKMSHHAKIKEKGTIATAYNTVETCNNKIEEQDNG